MPHRVRLRAEAAARSPMGTGLMGPASNFPWFARLPPRPQTSSNIIVEHQQISTSALPRGALDVPTPIRFTLSIEYLPQLSKSKCASAAKNPLETEFGGTPTQSITWHQLRVSVTLTHRAVILRG
eukprot:scaffold211324_cov26-Tisochrysis_lutea.AAC.2